MTMTTKRQRRTPASDHSTVTVNVNEPHLVYHDGEQRGGTLTGVPTDVAEHWQRHGWATIVD
ncbi:hypothetical protein [Mycobacterium sp. 852002-10029_SCH5224772]|uniref:hypothetical protein n=1 Tax=Mycobacterium sp. 852002-10029_SCH5224772 TaxID=1834083 RepID=UPI0007FF3EF8|nr:hypothetical protein [Mycobacterium sp. 852002-10029_SCH5224772]OBF00384.1 hypothetical protein A5775_05810 [Mycobacterium sp. 852002-10029_SCH5224772]